MTVKLKASHIYHLPENVQVFSSEIPMVHGEAFPELTPQEQTGTICTVHYYVVLQEGRKAQSMVYTPSTLQYELQRVGAATELFLKLSSAAIIAYTKTKLEAARLLLELRLINRFRIWLEL